MKRYLCVVMWVLLATTVQAQTTIFADRFVFNLGPRDIAGSGDPNGQSTTFATPGSTYRNIIDGTVWRKTGSGNTGWIALSTFAFTTVAANQILAGPTSGAAALPAFRAMVDSDLSFGAPSAGGNLLFSTGGLAWAQRLIGPAGTILYSNGSTPAWSGITWPNAINTGDVVLGGATGAVSVLPAVASGQVLISNGALALPSYSASPALTSIGGAGNLTLNPVGDLITNPAGKDLLPSIGYDINIGALSNKYRQLHVAELWVETLVAQNTIATIGGRVVVAPTNILTRDLTADNWSGAFPAQNTSICVKYGGVFKLQVVGVELGSKLIMQADNKFEAFVVLDTIQPSVTAQGDYCYTVRRNQDSLANAGTNDWYAGDAIVDTGKFTQGPIAIPGGLNPDGFIDVYSISGLGGSTQIGPTIVGNVRTGIAYNAWAPRWAIGNLSGLYNYSAPVYGVAMGSPTATNITIDEFNGFRIRNGTTNKLVADTNGSLSLTGDLSLGTAAVFRSAGATEYGTGIGYWLDYNAGNPRFRIGDPAGTQLSWNGSTLTLSGTGLVIGNKAAGQAITIDDTNGMQFWYNGSSFGYIKTTTGTVTFTLAAVFANPTAGTGGQVLLPYGGTSPANISFGNSTGLPRTAIRWTNGTTDGADDRLRLFGETGVQLAAGTYPTTFGEGLFVDSSNRAGIGTATPATALEVVRSSTNTTIWNVATAPIVTLHNTSATTNNWTGLQAVDSGGTITAGVAFTAVSHTNHYGRLDIGVRTAAAGTFATELSIAGGVVIGNPTGTFKGVGTANFAGAIYANGTIGATCTLTVPAHLTVVGGIVTACD